MKLVVLGSGTCVPTGVRVSSGYWIEAGSRRIRLDCGAGTVHAMGRWGVPWVELTHQVITHFHIDHCAELPSLLFTLKHGRRPDQARTAPLEIVGPAGTRKLVEDLQDVLKWRILEQEFPVELTEMAPGEARDAGDGVTIRFAKTPHTVESVAVRVEHAGRAIAYTGDTSPSDELPGFFRDVDVLVAECSFMDDDKKTPHLTADGCARLAAASRARHLVATHCYFDPEKEGLAERLARNFGGKVTVATDGLTVEV